MTSPDCAQPFESSHARHVYMIIVHRSSGDITAISLGCYTIRIDMQCTAVHTQSSLYSQGNQCCTKWQNLMLITMSIPSLPVKQSSFSSGSLSWDSDELPAEAMLVCTRMAGVDAGLWPRIWSSSLKNLHVVLPLPVPPL